MPCSGKGCAPGLRSFFLGLVAFLLGAGILGFPSLVEVLSLEGYISRSKLILIGRPIERTAEPIRVEKRSPSDPRLEKIEFYSLKIEVSRILKGEVAGNNVRLLYPVFKLRKPRPEGLVAGVTCPLPDYSDLDKLGEVRIWFLTESKTQAGFYERLFIYPAYPLSLVERTLRILELSEPEQVAELIKMLASGDKSFVLHALDMLSRRKANAAAETLISMLTVNDQKILDEVIRVLVAINNDAGNLKLIQLLQQRLKKWDGWSMTGWHIAENLRDPRLIPVLIEALAHPNRDTKMIALSKLGHLKVKEAVQRMLPLINYRDDDVRQETYRVLGEIGDPRALPSLWKALEKAPDPDRGLIMKAIQDIQSSSGQSLKAGLALQSNRLYRRLIKIAQVFRMKRESDVFSIGLPESPVEIRRFFQADDEPAVRPFLLPPDRV